MTIARRHTAAAIALRSVTLVRHVIRIAAGLFIAVMALSARAAAQAADQPDGSSSDPAEAVTLPASHRMFGVLPNYATVERDVQAQAMSPREMLRVTAKNSFDPYVFPFVGASVAIGQGGSSSFGNRYATAFADNAIGNFMTSAIFPAMLHQDPRYYQRGTGGVATRAAYALSRTVVTRSSEGRRQFNYSEVVGNFTAGALSNAYYSAESRSVTATLTRWGMQVMWDTVSNELKEFWPDIRNRLRKR
jgi:hypothetical protein